MVRATPPVANRRRRVALVRKPPRPPVPAVQSKEDVLRVVQALPDETSLDDVIERLILLRKVNVGLSQEGQRVPQSEAEAEFRTPRAGRPWNRG